MKSFSYLSRILQIHFSYYITTAPYFHIFFHTVRRQRRQSGQRWKDIFKRCGSFWEKRRKNKKNRQKDFGGVCGNVKKSLKKESENRELRPTTLVKVIKSFLKYSKICKICSQ